jgi:hypothetical protein
MVTKEVATVILKATPNSLHAWKVANKAKINSG